MTIDYYSKQNTGLVTHSLNEETAKHTSATASEKNMFVKLLEEAKLTFGSNLKLITTDGHTGIVAHMRDKEKNVAHNLVSRNCY